MIITVGGIKGGSGKTTIATNLSLMSSLSGSDVLLIDADDQETATDFLSVRKDTHPDYPSYTNIKLSGVSVRTETENLSQKYGTIIIDTGGRDTTSQRAALSVSDTLLIPFVPRSFDLWTIEKVSNVVEEIQAINPKLKAFTFINRADPTGQDNQTVSEELQKSNTLIFLDAPIGNRKAFGNAAAYGLSVLEVTPRDEKAINEISTLYSRIFNGSLPDQLRVVGE